jgi:uncharacterized membrane protein
MAAAHEVPRSDLRYALAGLAILAVVVGIGFRLWDIGEEPLWLDEGYSAYAASKGFQFLWHIVPLYETHPPFYYSVLRVWTLLAGDQLVGLRSLGVVCGLATLAAIAIAAREIGLFLDFDRARRAVFITAAICLAAFSPMLVEMTREVRPYPLLILVNACATGALFRLGRRMERGAGLGGSGYGVYLFMLALTLWLHNLGVLYAAAMGLALLALVARRGWTKRDWIAFVGGHVVVLLVWLPAVAILLDQAPTWVKSTWLHFPPPDLADRIITLFVVPQWPGMVAALALFAVALMGCIGTGAGRRAIGALLLLALLPLALSLMLSAYVTPIFILRTMTPVAVAGILLLAQGVAQLRGRGGLIGAGAVLIIISQMAMTDIQLRQIGAQQKWYEAVDWLALRYTPGDMVYAYPNEGALPFRYAVRDRKLPIRTRPIPTDMPTLDGGPGAWNPTGSRGVFSLPKNRLEAIAAAPATRHIATVWLLRLGPWAYDKGDHLLHALERDRVQVGRFRSGPIDIIGLRRKDLPPVASPKQAEP